MNRDLEHLQLDLATAQAAAANTDAQLERSKQLLLSRSGQAGAAEGLAAQLDEAMAQRDQFKAAAEAAQAQVTRVY